MRKRASHRSRSARRSRSLPLLAALRSVGAGGSDAAGFHADRARPLSRDRGRLRRLPHRPGQRPAVRRRPADRDAVRQLVAAQHHARPRHRHRRLDRRRVRRRRCAKALGRNGARLYPAMPYTVLHEDVARRRAGDPRLSRDRRAGAQRRSTPTRCRSRSTSARRCGSGMRSISSRGEFQADPQQSAEWNRGAYLVQGPGHCGACHTPKIVPRRRQDQRISARLHCRAGSRPTSPTTTSTGLGRWSRMTSRPI